MPYYLQTFLIFLILFEKMKHCRYNSGPLVVFPITFPFSLPKANYFHEFSGFVLFYIFTYSLQKLTF